MQKNIAELIVRLQLSQLGKGVRMFGGYTEREILLLELLDLNKRIDRVEIAEKFKAIPKSLIYAAISKFREAGLVSEVADSQDQRIVWVSLTFQGTLFLEIVRYDKNNEVSRLINNLGLDNAEHFTLLDIVNRAIKSVNV